MKIKLFFIANLSMTLLLISSHATTLDICKNVSQATNNTLPIKKDNFTILKSTGCLPSTPKNIIMYVMEVSVSAEIGKQIDLRKDIKPAVLNTFCTDPQVRILLNAFDVDHRYYTNKGEYIGSFLMSSKECK